MFDRQNRQRAIADELMRTTVAMSSIFTTPVDRSILDFVLNVTIATKDQARLMTLSFDHRILGELIAIDILRHDLTCFVAVS